MFPSSRSHASSASSYPSTASYRRAPQHMNTTDINRAHTTAPTSSIGSVHHPHHPHHAHDISLSQEDNRVSHTLSDDRQLPLSQPTSEMSNTCSYDKQHHDEKHYTMPTSTMFRSNDNFVPFGPNATSTTTTRAIPNATSYQSASSRQQQFSTNTMNMPNKQQYNTQHIENIPTTTISQRMSNLIYDQESSPTIDNRMSGRNLQER
jgi:hypothetical protein